MHVSAYCQQPSGRIYPFRKRIHKITTSPSPPPTHDPSREWAVDTRVGAKIARTQLFAPRKTPIERQVEHQQNIVVVEGQKVAAVPGLPIKQSTCVL